MNDVHDTPRPLVSVVIPVFNDSGRLDTCLRALAAQTYPADRYEVIVVDNGSQPPAAGQLARQHPQVTWTDESVSSSYAARNRGIALARGEVFAFTDSDCVPAADWIEQGVAALRGTVDCGLVAGQVESFAHDPHDPTIAELYDQVASFPQQEYVDQRHFGATANVFTTAAVIRRVGPFNPGLKSGGDYEWGQRVFAAGYRQIYAAAARVRHPARRSLRTLIAKRRRLAGGNYLLDRTRIPTRAAAWWRVLIVIGTRVLPQPGLLARLWRDQRLTHPGQRLGVVACQCLLNYAYAWEYARIALGGSPRR